MTSTVKDERAPELRQFKEAQRLAYDCTEAVDPPHARHRAEERVAA
ncbi:hypothetical protein AB0L71_26715 [Streptomyces sp. NPDC052052]